MQFEQGGIDPFGQDQLSPCPLDRFLVLDPVQLLMDDRVGQAGQTMEDFPYSFVAARPAGSGAEIELDAQSEPANLT